MTSGEHQRSEAKRESQLDKAVSKSSREKFVRSCSATILGGSDVEEDMRDGNIGTRLR